ncbi:MAG: acetyl-CoA carboxylase carboxyl transferase subunit alpha [Acidobacteria bacterium]|nr:acetyl-CoA carboxylase carboxyl transferase subunit alpha [Acidobacteriota bacterium]
MATSAESLDIDEPIEMLLSQAEELRLMPRTDATQQELERLGARVARLRQEIYSTLTPWQRVLVARHPQRPRTRDHLSHLFTDFTELHGDRHFADDPGVVAGFARFDGNAVMVVGHQRSLPPDVRDARPEGYRKALRCMRLAEKCGRPVVTFVESAGLSPDVGSEARGMADAIAHNLREMAMLEVPVVVVVTGEACGGTALALAVGDYLLMLEYAVYSVVPAESAALMLWGDRARAGDAADGLKLTASDLIRLGVIDEVVPEPLGGAHADPVRASRLLFEPLRAALATQSARSRAARVDERHARLRRIGHAGIDGA